MSVHPLTSLPPKWTVRKLKHLASIRFSNVDKRSSEDEPPVRLCNYMDVYHNHEITTEIAFMEASASKAEIEKFSLKRGDVLITKDSESWDDIAISARVCNDMPNVLCGYHLAQIRSRQELIEDRFLNYCFNAPDVQYHFHTCATGITRYGLSNGEIGSAPIPVTDQGKQTAIADFLDRETARIDALIAKKERLLELLEEKRAALISRAVTKGLNPNTELKDSGIPWIGKIPKDWSVKKLKYCSTKIKTGGTPPVEYIVPNGAYDWYTPGDFNGDLVLGNSYRRLSEEAFSKGGTRIFPENTILIVGIGATLGKVGLSPRACWANQQINFVVTAKGYDPQFIVYYLSLHRETMRLLSDSSTLGIMNQEKTGLLPIPVSTKTIQEKIVSHVRKQSELFDALKIKITRIIELLSEKRTALISAAVTGKIEVKGGSQ